MDDICNNSMIVFTLFLLIKIITYNQVGLLNYTWNVKFWMVTEINIYS